jgi:hypothetical protein
MSALLRDHERSSGVDDWPEPDWSILDDSRGVLPEFDLAVLHEGPARWVERAARGAGVTHAHVVIPLLGVV